MTGDGHGTQRDATVRPAGRVAPRGTGLLPPVTLGVPRWQRRYRQAVRAADAATLGCSPGLYLMWRELVALPLVAVAASLVALGIAGRIVLHGYRNHLRRRGRALSTVLAVGTTDAVAALVARTRDAPHLGWRVTGACTPTGAGPDGAPDVAGVPVLGDLDSVAALALAGRLDAVAVAPAPGWTAVRLQQLAGDLDFTRIALLADPRLVGPHRRGGGVDGLPLVRLVHPVLAGPRRVVKGAGDRIAALLLLLLVAPLLVACVVAVRRDGGPALRRQVRVGRGGREFSLLTFRTTGADGARTPVGRLLCRWCLDELPQLLNVLAGVMALVGPRPADPAEIITGDRAVRRRLLVKPGITGLWPASGADAELRYLERWSPLVDLRILVRSLRAALGGAR